MPSILFVCTANRFRSPVAAAMLEKSLEERGIAGILADRQRGHLDNTRETGHPKRL